MKTKKAAEAIIILGSLTIASFVCPSPCPHIIFGALVVVFGVVLMRKLQGEYYLASPHLTILTIARHIPQCYHFVSHEGNKHMIKPIVFVSSTIRGMEKERSLIKKLFDADLRYEVIISEYEGSKPRASLAQCKKWARECDIFIAILGNSYGFTINKLGILTCPQQ